MAAKCVLFDQEMAGWYLAVRGKFSLYKYLVTVIYSRWFYYEERKIFHQKFIQPAYLQYVPDKHLGVE
jgi:hypothetical protein